MKLIELPRLKGLGPASMYALGLWITVAAVASAGPEQSKDTGKKTNPLVDSPKRNPLIDEDPFLGVFKGATMTVQVRLAKDGSFEGNIEKGESSFPLKGKREGAAMVGSFSAGEDQFAFSASIEGNTLKLKTSDREFTLDREGVLRRVVPEPKPPVVNPPAPTPPSDKTVPSVPIPTAAKPGRAWDGFAPGTYVLMEDVASPRGKLPKTQRGILIFQGTDDGKEIVQLLTWKNEKWEPRGQAMPWMATSKSPVELGFVAGKTTSEILEAGGMALVCSVTEYTRDEERDGRRGIARLQVWKSDGVELPPQTLLLPFGGLLLGPGVVRVTNVGDNWNPGKVDFKLVALKEPFRLGDRDIRVAVFKGTETLDTQEAKLSIVHHRLLSSEVPGGIVRLSQERRSGDEVISTATGNAIEFGTWKPSNPPANEAK